MPLYLEALPEATVFKIEDCEAIIMTGPEIPSIDLEPLSQGGVRDMYKLDEERLVVISADRISAYGVVLPEVFPNKGRIQSSMTEFWSDMLEDVVPNQLVDQDRVNLPEVLRSGYYAGRVTVARLATMIPIECIVRGHLSGSAWNSYLNSGTVHGITLPVGMLESEKFSSPLFTPSTKPKDGHRDYLTFDETVALVGGQTAEQLRDVSLGLFAKMYEHAANRGVTIANTKFEFGYPVDDQEVTLCDEVGTPDSSRFWLSNEVGRGTTPSSYDKKYVIEYLLMYAGWDRKSLPPSLPNYIVSQTTQRYAEIYQKLTDKQVLDIPGALMVT
ncbi:MAG: phosphoribosylaminoimidazolesuccinocarboxamide synthase [Candidatus Saccharimonadales bacterium]